MEDNNNVAWEEVEKQFTEEIKSKLDTAFGQGLMTGWNIAAISLYNQVKDMTSARKIIKFLRKARDEAKERNEVNKSEQTPTP